MELTDRQIIAYNYVKDHEGCTAADVAEAIRPGSDSRGAAQTLRTLDRLDLVHRNPDRTYRLVVK